MFGNHTSTRPGHVRPPSSPPPALADAPSHDRAAASCASCSLKTVCLPCCFDAAEVEAFAALARLKRRIAPGASVFRAGDPLQALYAIHGGAFKMVSVSRDGNQKLTGFYLPGELIGLDAISTGIHVYDATALEASEVCVIPFRPLERMASAMPALQQRLLRALSADIAREHGLMLLLAGMSAEQRLAAFLLSLSKRYRRLGYSPDCFVLRMTREEIGSYLGLTLETVSRILSRLQREKLIAVNRREVQITEVSRLSEIAGM